MKLSDIRKIQQNLPAANASAHTHYLQQLMQQMGMEPGSIYQELEMDSPYVDTHQDISSSNANFQFHSHTFYEMLCCRNNCGAEYLIAAERYKLQKGDIIFIPPGVSHRPLLPEQMAEPYIRDVIWFSEEFLHLICNTTPELQAINFRQPFLFRTAGTRLEYLCELFRNGVREAESSQLGWSTIVASYAGSILIHFARAGADSKNKPMAAEEPELLDQVLLYVEEHMAEKISLTDTAHHFFISESSITQIFRKKMGISFYRYVIQRRLIASKTLIERNVPLDNVAEMVGFTDYSSFYRAFKQEYGISPRQYRKLQNP